MEKKEKTNLIVALGLVIAIIVLAINTKAPDVNIGNIQDLKDTLSVSGSGKVTVEPDKAEVYVRILTEAANAKAAQDDNAEIADSVRNALNNKGVKDNDMETSSYSLYPKTSYDRETGESEIYGYSVTHILKVETKDTDSTGDLVDAAVSAGANGLDRVNFLLSDELRDSAYRDALEKASANAKGKAMSMAKALSVDLGEITSVSESGAMYSPYMVAGAAKSFDEAVEMAVPTVISAQDIEVNANVGVVYAIE
jgi:uncharacterized protein YggE